MRPLRPIGPINAPPFAQPRHHSAPIILPTPQALSQPVTWFVFPGGGERAKAPTCLTKPAARPNLPPRLGSPAQPGPPQDQFNGPNSTEPWPDDVTKDQVVIELNTDFSTKGLSAQEVTVVVAAWQSGALNRDSMLDIFRRGEDSRKGDLMRRK